MRCGLFPRPGDLEFLGPPLQAQQPDIEIVQLAQSLLNRGENPLQGAECGLRGDLAQTLDRIPQSLTGNAELVEFRWAGGRFGEGLEEPKEFVQNSLSDPQAITAGRAVVVDLAGSLDVIREPTAAQHVLRELDNLNPFIGTL